ncbi:hypothetical protein NECAME_16602 [Necator americanus]|uniref:Endonuclease/exonuclease/phosphatase domain-containing protein n=1 Tax=Necator americanus TaxID=51031 RepID=W2TXZ6_NECAM|nr:hypothetical protein NECAME_16602 [Necator americanus]ETN85887.1 hypothetical protein NECAME_16602 [Necator americanus]
MTSLHRFTSVRPKACNQVTGRCKRDGLESPPTNKLHMSTPGERSPPPKTHGTRGTCDSRGFGGVGDLVNTSIAKNNHSFEQLTTRIGRLRMRRSGQILGLTIFVVSPTSSCEEEKVEAFYMDLEKFCREDHAFYKVIIGDFNAKVGPGRTPEELHIGTHGLKWNEEGERLSEFIMTIKTVHGNSQFLKPSSLR